MPRYLSPILAAVLLAAHLPTARAEATAPARISEARINEAWISEDLAGEEMDSLAVWQRSDGPDWLIASAKQGQRLLVFDAETGARIGAHGGPGSEPGRFQRPNGIAVAGDLLFVVERDGARVQVLRLPGFEPVGQFGQEELQTPYGLWLDTRQAGAVTAYVTDSFMADFANRVLPAPQRLAERVKRYRVAERDGKLEVRYLGAFGDTGEDGALRMVESIAGDIAHDRLLIADEDRRHESTLREYSFSGRYTGRSLPQDSFGAQAEGVALWTCPDGSGYWIAVDQLAPLTIFHLFDRKTLAPLGSFQGKVTSHTDGVALHGPTRRFPGGVLYAVHDDKALAAFDLREVARTLRIAPTCLQQ